MLYFYIKALHIVFVVTWFAGLFYIVRLFVYHTEASDKPPLERSLLESQFKKMEKGLWFGITYPSMILTVVFGITLVYLGNYWTRPWMLMKFGFVILLLIYHFICGHVYNQLKKDVFKFSSFQLRMWNEVASILLISIVFIVTLKDLILTSWAGILFVVVFFVLMSAVYLAKKSRERKKLK